MGETSASRLATAITAFAEEVDEGRAEPVSGAVAALVTALAASLAAAAAERSRAGWNEAGGARAQAQALRRRAVELAERDAAAYAAAREALAKGVDDWRLGGAVERAAEPPVALAASAADVAQLARAIADRGAGDVRDDALVAAMLAAAAARAAAHLVRINLVVGGDQQPAALAQSYADTAAAAAGPLDPAEL